MQARKYDGGEVTVWRRDDGRIEVSISCLPDRDDQDWLRGKEIEGTEHGPSAAIALPSKDMGEMIGWLALAMTTEILSKDAA